MREKAQGIPKNLSSFWRWTLEALLLDAGYARPRIEECSHAPTPFRLLFIVVCLPGAAEAQVRWSSPANVCVPDGATIQASRHRTSNDIVYHQAGNLDQISLNCSVGFFSTGGFINWRLGLLYQDSTGVGATAFIRARIFRRAASAAGFVLMQEINSNSFAATGTTSQQSATFAQRFNFAANNYWVQVVMDRAAVSEVLLFHGVFLVGVP